MAKEKPLFERMADDVALAVIEVFERYKPEIKRRKCSKALVGYWIDEGAWRGIKKIQHRKERAEP